MLTFWDQQLGQVERAAGYQPGEADHQDAGDQPSLRATPHHVENLCPGSLAVDDDA